MAWVGTSVRSANHAAVATQPAGPVLVRARPDLRVVVGRQPLLHVGQVARLKVVPFDVAGRLDPLRAKTRGHGEIDQACQIGQRGRCTLPHGGQLGGGRRALPEPLAEEHAIARRHQAAEEPEGFGGGLPRGLFVAQRVAGAEAEH